MGLDMYLDRVTMFYDTSNEDARDAAVMPVNVKNDRVKSITESMIYWRKANHIHRWFVNNVQNGEDNCGTYLVNRDDISSLLAAVTVALDAKDKSPSLGAERALTLLPPASGFLFGSTDLDERYWSVLDRTKKELEDLLAEMDLTDPKGNFYQHYTYSSSW
jgi:hypothetical protein